MLKNTIHRVGNLGLIILLLPRLQAHNQFGCSYVTLGSRDCEQQDDSTLEDSHQKCTMASKDAMNAVQFEAGGPEKMSIGSVQKPSLLPKDILINVKATAINRADTLQRKGLYPAPSGESSILGLEAAGIICQLGEEAKRWTLGEKVMALLPGGGNAEYVAVHEDHAMAIPEGMDWSQAASIPEVWLTAFQLLHTVAGVQSGDRVLIHAGGSGVGTAAVQLVALAGGVSYVTAGSNEKIDMAKSLGATEGFNYKEGSFSEKVLAATDGKGVNIILDCVGSSFWEENINSLAVDGTWVLYGLLGGSEVSGPLLAKLLRKRINLKATTLRARDIEYKSKLVEDFARVALPHFAYGRLKPIIHMVYPALSHIAEAHRLMESNENTGKIVLLVE